MTQEETLREIQALAEKILEKTRVLLAEVTVPDMTHVAKASTPGGFTPIATLQLHDSGFMVRGRIVKDEGTGQFKRNGDIQFVRNLLLKDNSGEIWLTLWNEDVHIEKMDLDVGSMVDVKAWKVGFDKHHDRPQVLLGKFGTITPAGQETL